MRNFIVSNELKRFGYNQNNYISKNYNYQMFINSFKIYFSNRVNENDEIIELDDKIKLLLRINIKSYNNIKITIDEFLKKTIKYHIFNDNSKSYNLTYYIDKQIPNYITFLLYKFFNSFTALLFSNISNSFLVSSSKFIFKSCGIFNFGCLSIAI